MLGVPGTAVVAGGSQHVVAFENGAAAMNASIQWHTVDDSRGQLALDDVKLAIDLADHHQVPVSAVFIENTHMASSGTPWAVEAIDAIAALGLPVHLDGARLFNAEVATGVSVARYASAATTVMCCLSKGLGAPVGSLLAGPREVIERARGERKRLGGSMRQAGVLAAPGLIALRENVDRLAEDHERAHVIAEAVASRWPGAIDPDAVRTNLVVFRPPDADAFLAPPPGERGVRRHARPRRRPARHAPRPRRRRDPHRPEGDRLRPLIGRRNAPPGATKHRLWSAATRRSGATTVT